MLRFDDFKLMDPRPLGRLIAQMGEQPPRYTRPPYVQAADIEAWLQKHERWSDGLEDRLRAARRLLFVRWLVDERRVSDEPGGRS